MENSEMEVTQNATEAASGESYRFVRNPGERRSVLLDALFWLFLFIFWFYFWDTAHDDDVFLILFIVMVAINVIWDILRWLVWCRQRITLNAQGIVVKGMRIWTLSSGERFLKSLSWSSVVKVRKLGDWTGRKMWLEFSNRLGEKERFSLGNRNTPSYVGEGHALSLVEAIERFYEPVERVVPITPDFSLPNTHNGDLGDKNGHIAIVAVLMILAAVALIPFDDVVLLNATPYLVLLCGIAALIVYMLAWRYARWSERYYGITGFVSVLCAGTAGILMLALLNIAPSRLGEAYTETFAIARETEREQIWQSLQTPDMNFPLYLNSAERVYRGIGTQQTFTLYRGPVGLLAIDRIEFHLLQRKTISSRNKP
jgi:hypothetical protein